MRANHSSGSPLTATRELDVATPKPPTAASPVLYDSASSLDAVPARSQPEDTGSFVHEIYSPAARSPTAFFHDEFQNPPDALLQFKFSQPSPPLAPVQSTTSAVDPAPLADMPDRRASAQDNRPARGRAHPSAPRGRGLPGHQPPAQHYPPATVYRPPSNPPDASHGPPNYPNPHAQFQSPPSSYARRGSYMPQYPLTPPAAPMGMGHPQSPQQYGYPNHPGLVTPDGSVHPPNPLMGYSQNALPPGMLPHTPMYAYSPHGPSPESASSSSSYAGTPNPNPQMYSPTHSSPPPPHSPHGPPGSSPYAVRYSTPTYGYPPHSFAHSGNTLYPSQYPYGRQQFPPAPTEQEGRWWYMPSASGPPPSTHFEAYAPQYQMYNPMTPHEVDYGRPIPSTQPPGAYSNQPQPTYPGSAPPQLQALTAEAPSSLPREPPRALSEPTRSEGLSSSARSQAPQDGPGRRAFHPNPPSNRSEWVMWAGNVPSDATPDEIWRYFNQSPSPVSTASSLPSQASAPAALPAPPAPSAATSSTAGSGPVYGSVASVFLIARSNCAFVNFASEAHLRAAIAHFNGTPLRAHDPRCARLVCRVRAREDDLKAGVGGQRGAGMHTQWVREQRRREREAASPAPSASASVSVVSDATDALGGLSLSVTSEEEGAVRRGKRGARHSSSGGSYASTNSSLLSQHFSKRYFILKSLTQFDLDLSVEKGLWATQRHNEGILDQAYRTSKEVFLIFGVNKSGEFYGYAKMAGPVLRGEQRVPWASRSSVDSPPPAAPGRPVTSPVGVGTSSRVPQYLSPSDVGRFEESPLPMDAPPPVTAKPPIGTKSATAPAVMHHRHRQLSKASPVAPLLGELSYDENRLRPVAPTLLAAEGNAEDFALDPTAPLRAVKHPPYVDAEGIRRWDAAVGESLLDSVQEERAPAAGAAPSETDAPGGGDGEGEGEGPVWGESFRVEWLRVARLPFYRTRHLRNAWNHDREVKVSRDGTELEPGVGAAMLEEWDKPEPPPPPGGGAGAARVGAKSAGAGRQGAGCGAAV